MVQRAQEEREEGDGNHWGSYGKATQFKIEWAYQYFLL
jgi:hypothetical protein